MDVPIGFNCSRFSLTGFFLMTILELTWVIIFGVTGLQVCIIEMTSSLAKESCGCISLNQLGNNTFVCDQITCKVCKTTL